MSLAKLAQAARPGWDHGRPQGVEAGLEETYYWEPSTVTWSYAAHVAIVEVDRELGRVKIEKYAIAHDCGIVVNPLLVEGQITGGAAQGLGGVLLEEIAYAGPAAERLARRLHGADGDRRALDGADPPALALPAQPARRQRCRRRRCRGPAGNDRQRRLRRALAVRRRVQHHPNQTRADRRGYRRGAAGLTRIVASGRRCPNHASIRATQLYDRRRDELGLDEVTRIAIECGWIVRSAEPDSRPHPAFAAQCGNPQHGIWAFNPAPHFHCVLARTWKSIGHQDDGSLGDLQHLSHFFKRHSRFLGNLLRAVGSRPRSSSSWREMRTSLLIVSIKRSGMMTGMRNLPTECWRRYLKWRLRLKGQSEGGSSYLPRGQKDRLRTRFSRYNDYLLENRGAVRQPQSRSEVEAAIKARGADVYAGFLLPYLRPDMTILDCGCGRGTITLGLAEAVPDGRVVGVDLDKNDLLAARGSAALTGRRNLVCIVADGRQLPFHDAAFDAVLCHSMLETLDDPTNSVAELRRVTKHGGVVGAASVEYGGLILAGEQTAGPRRFYDIRQQLWRAAGIAEPNMGRLLRGLFQEAGFGRVEASADYISYGTPDRVRAFACDRAVECQDQGLQAAVARHGIASVDELLHLAAAWGEWSQDPGAFFAFAWCRVLAWP